MGKSRQPESEEVKWTGVGLRVPRGMLDYWQDTAEREWRAYCEAHDGQPPTDPWSKRTVSRRQAFSWWARIVLMSSANRSAERAKQDAELARLAKKAGRKARRRR